MTATEIISLLESQRNEAQRQVLMRFFKTGKGDYGEGDEFLGLKVPETRAIVKAVASETPLEEVPLLLQSRWHEVRLSGLLILVAHFEKAASKRLTHDPHAIRTRDGIVTLYLRHAHRANNWDLVDLSAPKIIGHWLLLPTLLGGDEPGLHTGYKQQVLDELAASDCLWKQRIGIVCTWKTTQQGELSWCWRYAERHLPHPHDLMHKAVGWMLREMGKRDIAMLRRFLTLHASTMPRTALRYAIEKLPAPERQMWMKKH
jgi:3-methyladenine DNA glycosylase AlkD